MDKRVKILALEPFIGFRKKNNPSFVVENNFCLQRSVILTQHFLKFLGKRSQNLHNLLFYFILLLTKELQFFYWPGTPVTGPGFLAIKGFANFRNE